MFDQLAPFFVGLRRSLKRSTLWTARVNLVLATGPSLSVGGPAVDEHRSLR